MTYAYECASCDHEWTQEQSMRDAPIAECPKCNKCTALRVVTGGTGFVLKGGGWHADLYSRPAPQDTKVTQ